MTLTTRTLNIDDYDQVLTVLLAKTTLGVSQSETTFFNTVTSQGLEDLLKQPTHVGSVFGCFSGKTLVGFLTTCLSSAHPCYFLRKAHTLVGAPLTTLPVLFDAALVQHESWGYKRFYTLYRSKDIDAYRKLWRASSVLSSYLAYSDLEVLPDTRPKHSDFWELLFGRTLYADSMTVRGFLKIDSSTNLPKDLNALRP